MWNYRAKCLFISSFFLSFICLFLCSLMRSSVHIECVCLRKQMPQVQWKSKRVPHKRPYVFFFCCKDAAQTVRMHMHMPIWNFVGHMYSSTSSHISCKYFYTVKTKIPWSDLHAYANLEFCWSDISWASLSILFKFLQKSWPAHISLTFICCKDRNQTVWMHIILSYQTSLIPHSTWDNK